MTNSVLQNRGERGTMAVEIVLFIPVLVALALLIVAFGRLVDTHGQVETISRDAVRAASLERSRGEGEAAMLAVFEAAQLPDHIQCDVPQLTGDFVSGGIISVEMHCTASWAGLGLVGLEGGKEIDRSSSAPIDTYRRTG